MTHFLKLEVISLITTALLAIGCGHKKSDDGGSGVQFQKSGCLQGVVMDGISGQRIALPSSTPTQGVKVLVHNLYKQSRILTAGDDSSLNGEYTVCDIPLDVTVPVYAWVDGYLPFESLISIPSTVASASGRAEQDVIKPVPTIIANMRLYKVGESKTDYKVIVTTAGVVLPGATVKLTPNGNNLIAQGTGAFLAPTVIQQRTLVQKTDASGVATFAAKDIVLGGVYFYEVLPPSDGDDLTTEKGSLTVGLKTTSVGHPYELDVGLDAADADLAVASFFPHADQYSKDGSITYYFNRPIEITPGTADTQTATLNFRRAAVLATNTPANNASEQVTATVNGRKLVLKPNFTTAPDARVEPGITVTYSGISVRPVKSPRQTNVVTLASTVTLFGGAATPAAPATFTIISGNTQFGVAGKALDAPLIVEVKDQYGNAIVGTNVSFTVTAGGGSFTATNVATDSLGRASGSWIMGDKGTQTATATVGSLAALNFSSLIRFSLDSGKGQLNWPSTALALPIVLKVYDTAGAPLQSESVTVSLASGNGTFTVNGGGSTTNATGTTTATGAITIVWTLGSSGTQNLTATWSGKSITLSADLLRLIAVSALTSTGAATTEVPIMVDVVNSNNVGVPSISLDLAVTGTANGSTISLTTGNGAATTAVTGSTNGNGRLSTFWKIGTVAATSYTLSVKPTGLTTPAITFTNNAP